MAKIQETIRWRDVSAGVVQRVSSDIAVPNSVPFAVNIDFDKDLGLAVSREGTNIVGSTLSSGNPCLGLMNFRDSGSGSGSGLLAAFNGSIYDVENATARVSGLSTTARWYFVTYLDTILALNGTDAPRTSTSVTSSMISSGGNLDAGNVPSGAQFPIEWHDRVYAAVTDRLYYTATPSSPSASTVSWTGTGSGSIQIEQEDGGGDITGLAKVPGYLLIFKERSLKRWNFDSTFPDDLVSLGTQSQASVVMARGRVFFFYGPKGFYVTNGSYPKRISRPIQRVVDAITSANYSVVTGGSDEEHVYWSIGDITLNFENGETETHNNVVVRYTIDTEQWTVYKYPDELRFFTRYISGTDVLFVGGTDNGEVLQLNTGNTDYNGNAITYILQSPEFDFGRRESKKTISDRIVVHSQRATGALLQANVDYEGWKTIGNVVGLVSAVQIQPLVGHFFEFRITDSTSGEQVKLRGLDFINVDVSENID